MDPRAVHLVIAFLVASVDDRPIRLVGVGSLGVRRYHAYSGRNPRTGEPVAVAAKRLPWFQVDATLVRELNGLPAEDLAATSNERGEDLDGDERAPAEPAPVHLPETDALAAEIRGALLSRGEIEVPELGTFAVVEKPGRPGVNPITGEPIVIAARKIVSFVKAPTVAARLDASRAADET
jgi:nucleoid DNA-binding protein